MFLPENSDKPAPIVSRAAVAALCGVSLPTVDKWVLRGCPIIERGSRGKLAKFSMAAVIDWRIHNAVESALASVVEKLQGAGTRRKGRRVAPAAAKAKRSRPPVSKTGLDEPVPRPDIEILYPVEDNRHGWNENHRVDTVGDIEVTLQCAPYRRRLVLLGAVGIGHALDPAGIPGLITALQAAPGGSRIGREGSGVSVTRAEIPHLIRALERSAEFARVEAMCDGT